MLFQKCYKDELCPYTILRLYIYVCVYSHPDSMTLVQNETIYWIFIMKIRCESFHSSNAAFMNKWENLLLLRLGSVQTLFQDD